MATLQTHKLNLTKLSGIAGNLMLMIPSQLWVLAKNVGTHHWKEGGGGDIFFMLCVCHLTSEPPDQTEPNFSSC